MNRIRKLLRKLTQRPEKLPMSLEELPEQERAWRAALVKSQTVEHEEALRRREAKEKAEKAAWWESTGKHHQRSQELMRAGDYEAAWQVLDHWFQSQHPGETLPWRTHDWPLDLEAAVARILAGLQEDDKERIRETGRGDLILFHHGWGTGIRNAFGLWKGNIPLLLDAGSKHPDDCSMVIIERVWEALQASPQGRE